MTTLPPLRVLYLDHTARMSGGEMALARLLETLDRTLVEPVVLLAEEGGLAETLRTQGITVHIFPLSSEIRTVRKDTMGWQGGLRRFLQLYPLWKYSERIAKFARKNNVDLIYTNSLKADFYGALAGHMAHIPVIWHIRDRIEESYLPGPAVQLVRLLARRLPICVVANSQSTLETLHLPATIQTEVIASGMTQEYIQRCQEPKTPHSIPQIGIIGRIASWKGQDIFLKAAARVLESGQDARFRIVGAPLFGEDAQLVTLKQLAKDLGIEDKVDFLGFQHDIPAQLRSLDILVHASVTPEPFGQVIVEGMVAGLPVIATNGGGAREIITHNKTGLLVPLGDPEALATSIQCLLENPEQADRLAVAGREHALQNYTVEISARKSEALYGRLINQQRTISKERTSYSRKETLGCLITLISTEIISTDFLNIFQ